MALAVGNPALADGIIRKPEGYPFNYPFLLAFMHTNGSPWNEMTKDLGEIKELAAALRARHAPAE
jgi:hypothetical protein